MPSSRFIRELIVSGTREGLAAARARGRVGGRPSVVNPDIIRAARDMLPNPDHSIGSRANRCSRCRDWITLRVGDLVGSPQLLILVAADVEAMYGVAQTKVHFPW